MAADVLRVRYVITKMDLSFSDHIENSPGVKTIPNGMMFSVTCGGLAMGGCLVWQTEQHGMNNNKRCPFKKKKNAKWISCRFFNSFYLFRVKNWSAKICRRRRKCWALPKKNPRDESASFNSPGGELFRHHPLERRCVPSYYTAQAINGWFLNSLLGGKRAGPHITTRLYVSYRLNDH